MRKDTTFNSVIGHPVRWIFELDLIGPADREKGELR